MKRCNSKIKIEMSDLSFTFCAARFPPLDSSFIVLGDVTPT